MTEDEREHLLSTVGQARTGLSEVALTLRLRLPPTAPALKTASTAERAALELKRFASTTRCEGRCLARRHHLRRRSVGFRLCRADPRCVVAPRGRLRNRSFHRRATCRGRTQGRYRVAPASARMHLPHGPRIAVCLGALPRAARPAWAGGVDERRCCMNPHWPARCQPTGFSPADAIRHWSAEGDHPIEDFAADDYLTPLPSWTPGAKTIADDGFVSEERILHPALTMVP